MGNQARIATAATVKEMKAEPKSSAAAGRAHCPRILDWLCNWMNPSESPEQTTDNKRKNKRSNQNKNQTNQ